MTYEEFEDVWVHQLQASGLRLLYPKPTETVDLASMDRSYSIGFETAGRQDAEPFFVAGNLSWCWDALQAARTHSTEDDLLTHLLGRNVGNAVETEPSLLRVDIELKASLTHCNGIPMPGKAVLSEWVREVVGRLERIERLLPDEVEQEGEGSLPAILGWQGHPTLEIVFSPDGELKLNAVALSAGQFITVPRNWDDSEREHDEGPGEQLSAMFKRVRLAISAWMEALDHLTK